MDDLSDQNDQFVSKTRRKKQAKEVEQVAEQLVAMAENQVARIDLPDAIARELMLARSTEGRSSQRRQVKHLAGLLRKDEDVLAAVQQQLNGLDQVARQDRRQFHQIEDLRDRLCDAGTFAAASMELEGLAPQINMKVVTRLARSVHEHGDRRAYRDLFRRIKQALEEADGE